MTVLQLPVIKRLWFIGLNPPCSTGTIKRSPIFVYFHSLHSPITNKYQFQLPIYNLYRKNLKLCHGALQQKEMNNWIGPTVKRLWNDAIMCCIILGFFYLNTTAYCLGQYSLHLLLPKSSMVVLMIQTQGCRKVSLQDESQYYVRCSSQVALILVKISKIVWAGQPM